MTWNPARRARVYFHREPRVSPGIVAREVVVTTWQDLRFATRMLLKDRLVTLVAIVTLVLGIGANSTVFTCMNVIVLGSLPYPAGDRIFHVNSRTISKGEEGGISYPDVVDMRAQARSFEALAAFRNGTMNIADAEHLAERLNGAWMTANAFDTLGQPPLIGRGFLPEDDQAGASPVAILGYGSSPADVRMC